MVQETGETRDAIIEDDNKRIQDIIDANKDRRNPYWIVVFAKPSKTAVDGKPTLLKHIKAYDIKPAPQVGMIVGTVDNTKGSVDWEVNMPQRPFDYDALQEFGAKPCDEVVVETTTIPGAYITK
jgi:hypothetical protein